MLDNAQPSSLGSDKNLDEQILQKRLRMSRRSNALGPTTASLSPTGFSQKNDNTTNFLNMSHDEPPHRQVEYDRNRPISTRVDSSQFLLNSLDSAIVSQKPRRGQGGRPLSQAFGNGGLNQSTYVRNPTAFSVIQNDIAQGRSKYNFLILPDQNKNFNVQSIII